jgi:soluble lytic murein transglycosylase-like protein
MKYNLPWETIEEKADKYNIDPALVAAFCIVESNGNTYAIRHEPYWKYKYKISECAKMCGITENTETVAQAMSWGLMQIMGTVAREHGYKKILSNLCNPNDGLEIGIKHLSKIFFEHKNVNDSIAAYNFGVPKKNNSGTYYNQAYVDKVLKIYSEIEKEAHA